MRPRHPDTITAILLLLLGLSALEADVRAQPAPAAVTAAEHGRRARIAYDIQRYGDAAAELRAAYALDPRPEYLYTLAQALRLGGRCPAAVQAYGAYLRTGPTPRQAEYARRNIARCGGPRAGAPAADPAHAAILSTPAPARRTSAAPPWYADALGLALCGGGVVVGATGGALLWRGREQSQRTNDATTYDEFTDNVGGERWQVAGAVAASVGALLIGAGVTRFVLRGRREQAALVLAPGPRRSSIALGVRF